MYMNPIACARRKLKMTRKEKERFAKFIH